jgi:hypothetical protein
MIGNISSLTNLTQLDIIKIEKSKINMVLGKNKNEFEYNGNMYDLIKTDMEGKFIVLYCLNDSKEQYLNIILSNLIDGFRDKHHQTNQRNINNFILSPAIIKSHFNIKRSDETNLIASTSAFNYNSVILTLLTPPPENIS